MEKPLEGMSVILACPTYGNSDPTCQKSLRVAIMSAAAKGLHWAGDSSPDRLPYGTARNLAAKSIRLNDGIDGIVWVDSDINLKPDSIVRLLMDIKVHGLDFVTGIYHSRKPPYLPVIYHWDGKRYLQCIDYPKDVIQTVDACGFGFCYTSAKTINAMADHPDFGKKGGWFPDMRDTGGFGEDIAFCDQAKKAGIRLYLDTGIQVGHQGDSTFIWEADFRAKKITLDSPELMDRYNREKGGWGDTTRHPEDVRLEEEKR